MGYPAFYTVGPGTTLTLQAVPEPGYVFSHWEGDVTGNANPASVYMDCSKTVTAIFAIGGSTTTTVRTTVPTTITTTVQTTVPTTTATTVQTTVPTTGMTTVPGLFRLSISKSGGGYGTVSSSDNWIYCGMTCSASIPGGTRVTLTATPSPDSTFAGWGGACSGTGATCTVVMNAAKSVTATFVLGNATTTVQTTVPTTAATTAQTTVPTTITTTVQTTVPTTAATTVQTTVPTTGMTTVPGLFRLSISKSGGGYGTVSSSDNWIYCGMTCSASIPGGTRVTLTATPSSGSAFAGWGGACSGAGATCTVVMNAAKNVTATFVNNTIAVSSTNATVSFAEGNPITGPPANYIPGTVVSFGATGVASAADITISYSWLPANPVFYKVMNGSWKQIYPANQTKGITNIALTGNILSFTIADNSDCDGEPADGVITDPIVAGSETITGGNLYFPHIATSPPWQTEIVVVNTGDQDVTATLRAFSDEGQLIETKAVTLSGHGRRQIDVASEFTDYASIGYVTFETGSNAVQGYTKFFREGYYRTAIPAVKAVNSSAIHVSHIAEDDAWWTSISLLNTTSETKDLTITFNTGQMFHITLKANEHRAFNIAQEFFNNQPPADLQSAVIMNAGGIVGLELFGSRGWGTQMEGILLTENTSQTIYYPHVANAGDGWWTGIVAYNPSESECSITITPYSDTGNPLATTTLPIRGKMKYVGAVANLGLPPQTGWFRMDSTRPLSGFELFGTTNGSQLGAYAGSGGTGAKAGVFPKIEKKGWTGIAFVNTENNDASVTLTAYNDDGGVVAARMITVHGHEKVVNNPEQIFTQDISNATYIAYTSDRNVVGFQLNGSADGTMLDGLPGL